MGSNHKFHTSMKLKIFATITITSIIVFIIFIDATLPNFCFHSDAFITHKSSEVVLRVIASDVPNVKNIIRVENKLKPEELQLLNPSDLSRRFDSRVNDFFERNNCTVQFFMTWFSPLENFGETEFSGLESLFQTNPKSCLVIVSTTMDSQQGYEILQPLINLGFCVEAITPDLYAILKNTQGESFLSEIKNGEKDPGSIPFSQNLSNLIRLGVLYKYGGIYLDTDFIILRDLSRLKNSIGAQSSNVNGSWSRLNNAFLAFDKNHPLLYSFIEDFVVNFDGNRWGYNGPYLVSRVVNRVKKTQGFNFTVLPPMGFYPVDWNRVGYFFAGPNDRLGVRRVKAKIRQLNGLTYGVHLWNKQSRRLKIEKGSIVWRLISDHCVICNRHNLST